MKRKQTKELSFVNEVCKINTQMITNISVGTPYYIAPEVQPENLSFSNKLTILFC
jgi:hypothetical protein